MAAISLCAWGWLNRPLTAEPWPERANGFAYAPVQAGSSPAAADYRDDLVSDLALLAARGSAVRTYSFEGSLAEVADLAAEAGLTTTAGIWLDQNPGRYEAQLALLREKLDRGSPLSRVILGNETLLRRDLAPEQLIAKLDALRAELDIAVGTAEPWHIWLANPELAEHVDFIGVHILPYWEGIEVDAAVDFVVARMRELETRFPTLPIVIAEVGWPSRGRARGDAIASHANAAKFLRSFMDHAQQENLEYFLLEAFDQPWKQSLEGEVGGHWGVFDANGTPKYAFDGAIVPTAHWPWLALIAILAAGLAFLVLTVDSRSLRWPGRVFLAAIVTILATTTVQSVDAYLGRYWTPVEVVVAVVLMLGLVGILALALVEAHEWAELRWAPRKRHHLSMPRGNTLPKVSIHVPIHREPPAMVIETLHALAALDYPHYEVLVVDNNTDDERYWRPVEACCAQYSFRFWHVAPLSGYKAGALNFALARTAPDTEIVAVIDSDYRVEPGWLRDLVTYFAKPEVGIVQAPQAYRDGGLNAFKSMCAAEYAGFFKIGMVTRNDRNAIIQHGTMTMIRRPVLDAVGGWAEWTVTEDAELGLRVLEQGHEAVYVSDCYGRGLTPDNFFDYKRQRFRWALGAMQILRRHAGELLGFRPSQLSAGQRFHFLTGWLGWLADGGNLLFNLAAIAWSLLVIAAPQEFEPPTAAFSVFVLALFAFKLVKMLHLYRSDVGASCATTLGAAIAGFALVYVVGQAVLAGLFRRRETAFFRTPKLAARPGLMAAARGCLAEGLLALGLLAAAVGVSQRATGADTGIWTSLLVVLALPHLAAIVMSLAGTRSQKRRATATHTVEAVATEGRRN